MCVYIYIFVYMKDHGPFGNVLVYLASESLPKTLPNLRDVDVDSLNANSFPRTNLTGVPIPENIVWGKADMHVDQATKNVGSAGATLQSPRVAEVVKSKQDWISIKSPSSMVSKVLFP